MNEKYWEKYPIYSIIYTVISREKSINFNELVSKVKEENLNISDEKIRNALIKLEIWNKIDVVSNGKETKILLRR